MTTQYEAEKEKYLKHFQTEAQDAGDALRTELETTPLFSLGIRSANAVPADDNEGRRHQTFDHTTVIRALPQYALLGLHIGDHPQISKREPIMLNTATPNSTFICGSQGSGKSYTLACILENYLLPDSDYGSVSNPVAGVAFHYDPEGSDSIAEVASLCSRGIKVRVLASRSRLQNRQEKYMELEGAEDNIEVHGLRFKDNDLNVERMKRLMAFNDAAETGVPLYVSVVHKILREMSELPGPFSFSAFEARLAKHEQSFAPNQKNMLNLRLDILRSFLHIPSGPAHQRKAQKVANFFKTEPGTLTIVDLTDPFIDTTTACVLFDICLGLFKQNAPSDGMVVALDEAHRYMNSQSAATTFTETLLTTIKMQRHTGTRIIIATQEPSLSPKLMDLCTTTIVHRFSSPAWFAAIKEHLAAASESEKGELFREIVQLSAGQSLVFSPTSFLCFGEDEAGKLGTGRMKMMTRSRKGLDTGTSKMAGGQQDGTPKCALAGLMEKARIAG